MRPGGLLGGRKASAQVILEVDPRRTSGNFITSFSHICLGLFLGVVSCLEVTLFRDARFRRHKGL